ncbi:peptide chain release factor N(5)-glutamine methyltransferase [Fulvivirgaceae bacterium BMA12]|uniref:peptide chain release factor N(5)-glutamine methyltransferase n=1 Tax=Agaribacillus aureus TaxID=3051825 RepID=A0ABT8LAN9_9BACT|nr:peptide chain release factor N(5)-glutamine methyltransferase [Fulvivirgaceae bacterium BMA12]
MELDMISYIDGYPKALHQWIVGHLNPSIDPYERQSLSYLIIRYFFGINNTGVIVNDQRKFSKAELEEVESVVVRLNKHEPIQYILGEADFYGRKFMVNPAVLIPRPETELLVDKIIKENLQQGLNVVDIGTGSGCIAISLKLALPEATITGVDVDEKALQCAKENAIKHRAEISWQQLDILGSQHLPSFLDIVVSNPPYVRESEKAMMQKNVLDFEPHLALFVNDEQPLIYYQAIAEKGYRSLKNRGRIYLEINEALAEEVVSTLERAGYENIEVVKDLQQKDRIVKGTKRG